MYEEGDYDGSASLLVPRLERTIRAAARMVGLATTGTLGGRGVMSGVRGLGTLLDLMRERVPERTRRYLSLLLSDVTSLNLRNRISHGLLDSVSQPEAALLIHAACLLSRLEPALRDEEE